MKKCGIYKITNSTNKKSLIGQSKNIGKRWSQHKDKLRRNIHANQHIQNAWNKYGEDKFTFEIILLCEEKDLDKEEERLIKEYGTTDKTIGYNIRDGGKTYKMSEETKKKLSIAHKGKRNGMHHSEETKHKMSESQKGEKHYNFGKHLSEKHKETLRKTLSGDKNPNFGKTMTASQKEKLLIANLGKKHTEEHNRKIAISATNRKHSSSSKLKISTSHLGSKNPMFGKHLSEETKQKMRETFAKNRLARLSL